MKTLFFIAVISAAAYGQTAGLPGNAISVNGAALPASQPCVGTNGNNQIVSGTCPGSPSGGSLGQPQYNSGTGFGGAGQVVYAAPQSGATADLKIAACMSVLGSGGGTCDTSGMNGGTVAADVFSNITAPITIVLAPGNWNFSAYTVIPKNFTLQFQQGALLNPAANITVNIFASIRADALQQIVVSPLNTSAHVYLYFPDNGIYPAWYGAKGDLNQGGSTDDTVAVQEWIDNAPDFAFMHLTQNFVMKISATINIYARSGLTFQADNSGAATYGRNGGGGPGIGAGSGFGWYGPSGGTMLYIDFSNSLKMDNLNFYCSGVPLTGFPQGSGKPVGCNSAIVVDQYTTGTPPGNITTENSFTRIGIVASGPENDAEKLIAVAPQSLNNIERQMFDHVDVYCSPVANPTSNAGVGFYLGNSSNAINETFTNGGMIDCGTAFWIVNGQDVRIEGNLLENNRRDFYIAAGGVQNVNYVHNRTEFPNIPVIEIAGGSFLSFKDNHFTGITDTGTTIQLDSPANIGITLESNNWDLNSSIIPIGGAPGVSASANINSFNNQWPTANPNLLSLIPYGKISDNSDTNSNTSLLSNLQFEVVPQGQNIVAPFMYVNQNNTSGATTTIPTDGILAAFGKTGDGFQEKATAMGGTSANVFINSFNSAKWQTAAATGITLPLIATVNVTPSVPANGFSEFSSVGTVAGLNVSSLSVANGITPAVGTAALLNAPTGGSYNYAAVFNGHIDSKGTAPTIGGTGCAIGSAANDNDGYLTLGAGATSCTVTFAQKFRAGICQLTPSLNTVQPTYAAPVTATLTIGVTYSSGAPTVAWSCRDVN